MTILNLTQHKATDEQKAAGVVDIAEEVRAELIELLTFESLPDSNDLEARAEAIAELAQAFDMERDQGPIKAMIGGAPYLMSHLEGALKEVGIEPVYAFSKRESVEETQPDGSVRKINVFRHQGFVR